MIDAQRIWSSPQLPSLPSVAIRLLEISRDPATEIKDVIRLIKSDPAITAKVLKSANSAFFGIRSEVRSVDQAVPLLGTTVVTSLALSFSLIEAAITKGPMKRHYASYWMQSVVQAAAAEILSEHNRRGLDCECFQAGLLMDLGRLAMLKTIPNEYRPVLERANQEQQALHRVESEMLGISHVEIGEKLVENWMLPEALNEAVLYHHARLEELQQLPGGSNSELIKTVAAAASAGDYFCSSGKGPALGRLQALTEAFFKFSQQDLELFLENVKARVDEAGDLFAVDADALSDPGALIAQANDHLAQLTLREHVTSTQASARQQAIERQNKALETENFRLQRQALYDPLTKVYNRHFFDEALENELRRCCRSAASLGVIFADIDNFKRLNDCYGHQFGDCVLQRVAQAFGAILRRSDVLCRYGGEEFVVLIHEPTEKGVAKVAERLRGRVESEEIHFEGQSVPVTVSLGAAIAIPGRSETELARRLVAAADEAMYTSKENGRNQVHIRSLLDESERRLTEKVTSRRFSRWLVNRKILDIPTVSKALLRCQPARIRLGELAVQHCYINETEVARILQAQQRTSQRFGQLAIRFGSLTEDQVAYLLAIQQEDPDLLARAMVQSGLVEQIHATSLVEEYKSTTTPSPCRAAHSNAAPGNR